MIYLTNTDYYHTLITLLYMHMHLLLNNLRIYMKMNKTDRPPFEFVQREPFAQRPMIYI